MHPEQSICALGYRLRLGLWATLLLAIICLFGLPTLIGLELEIINNNVWLNAFYTLLDHFSMTEEFIEVEWEDDDMIVLEPKHLILLTGIFITSSAFLLAIFWQVDRLFALYQHGQLFTLRNVHHFRMIGYLLIALFFFEGLADNAINYFLHPEDWLLDLPEEEIEEARDWSPLLYISLNLSSLLSGLFMVLVARVMALGVTLKEDVDGTI
ncbi:DUF2975 domain-containing protein [Aestuariirhabdus sp. Z084]|uniref:DUF2975 domain-containing protein n=1 Tax=Aestuariirhabdus haliotis TaxID=2918751 RepID=UPI00201B3ACC|nr:DUF2975 domain-containing protein [Aestuariirhabdus haliotis]MCL6417060.1 DUF2975 domain-containing protein [Aestuariirhabdus haliotis]MCL6420971.1 DUF2975 domain-containing protein [Aestuariirhabdus haliotis]